MKNILVIMISDQMKAPPHYLTTGTWTKVKTVLSEIKELLVDKVLKDSEIDIVKYFIDTRIDDIIENCDTMEISESINYIYGTLDWFLKKSVELEYYRISANIKNLSDKMCVNILN
jgi:hypothetical protein